MIRQIRTAITGGVLLALAAVCLVQTSRLATEQRDHANSRAAQAHQVAIHEAEQDLARARSDAAAATDADERLRAQLAAIAGHCRGSASNPNAAKSGQAADTPADLLADVQLRLDEAANQIARHADTARAAGAACERSYRALAADPAALNR